MLGNLAFDLPAVCANLEGAYAVGFRAVAYTTPTVTPLLASLRSALADGVAMVELGAVLPPE